jgi:energy-coupling factor transporter ATP-binding protein EcfA2
VKAAGAGRPARAVPSHGSWAALGSLLARPVFRAIRGPERDRLLGSWQELAARERALDDRLFLGIVGGTGVGKSTLINAIAGAVVSRAGDRRPTTDRVVVYRHARCPLPADLPGQDLSLPEAIHQEEGLERLVIFDFPDFDSVEADHAAILGRFLPRLDLLLVVVDDEKYADLRLFEVLRAVPQAEPNLHFVLNKLDRLLERYRGRWPLVAKEIAEDFSRKLEGYTGLKSRPERMSALSARVALERRTGNGPPDGDGAAEGDFRAVLELLESYRAEKRRRAAKEANLEVLKGDLVREAAEIGLDGALEARAAAARRSIAERRTELEALLAALPARVLGSRERRALQSQALERAGRRLGFAARLARLLFPARGGSRRVWMELPSAAAAHYRPHQESLRTAEHELAREVEELAGPLEKPLAAAAPEMRGREAGRSLEARLATALRFARLRGALLPLLAVLGWLWFALHPMISNLARRAAEGQPVDWGGLLRRALSALVAALSPVGIVAGLLLVIAAWALTALLDWRTVRRTVEAAVEEEENRAREAARREAEALFARLEGALDGWKRDQAELARALSS